MECVVLNLFYKTKDEEGGNYGLILAFFLHLIFGLLLIAIIRTIITHPGKVPVE